MSDVNVRLVLSDYRLVLIDRLVFRGLGLTLGVVVALFWGN
jgi:hypothetical protein